MRALTWLRRVASLLLRRDRVEAELDEEVSACFEITLRVLKSALLLER